MAQTPRIQVPLKPETRAALEQYADAMGLPLSQAAAQLLDQAAPSLLELASALRKAKESPSRAWRESINALNKATERANQIAMDLDTPSRKKKRA